MGELPNRIREYRKARGWTLERLGEEVGCSYVHVSEIERGEIELSQSWMKRFARALDVKPGDLLLPDENSDSLSPAERELVRRFRIADSGQRLQIASMLEIIVPQGNGKKAA